MFSLLGFVTSPGRTLVLIALTVMSAGTLSPAAALLHSPVSARPAPGVDRPFCSSILGASSFGRLSTQPEPGAEFAFVAGLWVGAEVDRGIGIETLVSSAAYSFDYYPVEPRAPRDWFRFVQTDTVTTLYPHEPLGLRVEQSILTAGHPGYSGHVRVHYVIENISAQWRPPGWTMEHVYVGMFMDPDVGRAPANFWSDDHGGFAALPHGGLAYAWDPPGNGDDTDARVGLLVLREPIHAFRVWSWELDPTGDAGEYLKLRGDSHDEPTIDPPTTRASDQRLLLSVGPKTLAPGEKCTFTVALVCDEGLGLARPEVALQDVAPLHEPVLVTPRLADAQVDVVTFRGLSPGVTLAVYDVSGRRVAALRADADGQARWELQEGGDRVASGVYLYRAQTGGRIESGKIVVAR